ncbi:MAG: CrcB family protein [Hyphomonadaceae bacterium]|nr:CrcB family protein [Hyphomonadaceae bacterium]
MREFLLVALGGALGASGRFGVNLLAPWGGTGVPWGTLAINAVGGLAMGLLFHFAADNRPLLLFAGIGVLGGFTTFSAFSMETVRLMQRGDVATAAIYVVLSVILSVGAAFAGFAAARSFA